MAQHVAGPEIERLIQLLARLPGLGPRSARRAALHLIKKRETLLNPLSDAMRIANERIVVCSSCGNVDTSEPCTICRDAKRDPSILVVVEDVSDLWALERSGAVNAKYHVLGGVLSPLDGVRPEHLNLERLVARVSEPGGPLHYRAARASTREGDQACSRRAGRRRARLSRRGHPVGGDPPAHVFLRKDSPFSRHPRPRAGDLDLNSALLHMIGMAGSSPAIKA
jgi:recombination protein RecR